MQRRTSGRGLVGLTLAVAALAALGAGEANGQTTYTFSTTATSNAWLNAANWTGNSGHFPGVDANASSTADGATTDIALFTTLAFSSSQLGINMGASTSTGVSSNTAAAGLLSLGAINYSGTTKDLTVGDSSSANGLLRLNGVALDPGGGSISNVILAISNTATKNLTIQPTAGGSGLLGLQLGSNAAPSVLYVATGRTLTITSIISELTTGSAVTIQGGGTTVLGGVNTYTGATTVTSGTLVLNSGGSLAAGSAVAVSGGTLGGAGTVNGALTVSSGGTVRGGSGNTAGNLTLTGGTTVTSGGTIATLLPATPTATITGNSALINSGTINLNSSGGAYNLQLLNETGLTAGTTYTVIVATGGSYQKNGLAYVPVVNAYAQGTDFNVVSGSGNFTYAGSTLTVNGSDLQLTFTPAAAAVPEPTTILGLSAVGLGAVRWLRRKLR